MIINQAGLNLIKQFEGLRLESYLCPAGKWTIGYGCTEGVTPGMKITQIQANQMLSSHLVQLENQISNLVKVPLTSNQFSALVSFAYNLGVGNLTRSSLLKFINLGDFKNASEQFLPWSSANGKVLPGLVRRREAERDLFLTA